MDRIKEALERAKPEWEAVLKHQKGSRANESHKKNTDIKSIPQRDGGAVDA